MVGEKGWQQMRSGYCEGLKRDKVVKIARSLSSGKNFVSKRERSLYSMRSLTFSQWIDLRM